MKNITATSISQLMIRYIWQLTYHGADTTTVFRNTHHRQWTQIFLRCLIKKKKHTSRNNSQTSVVFISHTHFCTKWKILYFYLFLAQYSPPMFLPHTTTLVFLHTSLDSLCKHHHVQWLAEAVSQLYWITVFTCNHYKILRF